MEEQITRKDKNVVVGIDCDKVTIANMAWDKSRGEYVVTYKTCWDPVRDVLAPEELDYGDEVIVNFDPRGSGNIVAIKDKCEINGDCLIENKSFKRDIANRNKRIDNLLSVLDVEIKGQLYGASHFDYGVYHTIGDEFWTAEVDKYKTERSLGAGRVSEYQVLLNFFGGASKVTHALGCAILQDNDIDMMSDLDKDAKLAEMYEKWQEIATKFNCGIGYKFRSDAYIEDLKYYEEDIRKYYNKLKPDLSAIIKEYKAYVPENYEEKYKILLDQRREDFAKTRRYYNESCSKIERIPKDDKVELKDYACNDRYSSPDWSGSPDGTKNVAIEEKGEKTSIKPSILTRTKNGVKSGLNKVAKGVKSAPEKMKRISNKMSAEVNFGIWRGLDNASQRVTERYNDKYCNKCLLEDKGEKSLSKSNMFDKVSTVGDNMKRTIRTVDKKVLGTVQSGLDKARDRAWERSVDKMSKIVLEEEVKNEPTKPSILTRTKNGVKSGLNKVAKGVKSASEKIQEIGSDISDAVFGNK